MLEVAKIIGLFWVAMILTYGIIALALIVFQWAYRGLKKIILQIRPLRKSN
jgi:hypothetical protein